MTDEEARDLEIANARRERNSRRKLRRLAGPAEERDLEIFKAVVIEGLTHEEAAHRYGLRRNRVTQIVGEVRRQLAHASPDDPQIESHLARQKLECELEKLRLEHVLQTTAKAMRKDPPILVTNRRGSRSKGDQHDAWSEVIERQKPVNMQIVKTYLRTTEAIGKLNQRDIAANPIDQKLSQYELIQAVANILCEWRAGALKGGDPPSDEFLAMVAQFENNLQFWIMRTRRGISAAEAWPEKPVVQRSIKQSERRESASDCANHPGAPINHDQAPASEASSIATSDEHVPYSETPIDGDVESVRS